jgi:hypothetical protein
VTRKKVGVRVEVGPDRESDQARVKRAKNVGALAPKATLYQNDAVYRASIDDLMASGVDLEAGGEKVYLKELELAQARAELAEKRQVYDGCYNTATAALEKGSPTYAEVVENGFDVLERVDHGLAPPSAVVATYDRGKSMVHVHVKYPWRNARCVIEMTSAPNGEGPFTRLEGSGVTRKLPHLAPGVWWFRAATLRATMQSEWSESVAVVVT